MGLYKKCYAKPYSILFIDTAHPSNNPLHFQKNLLELVQRVTMKTNDKIRDEKLQYDNNKTTTKGSTLSSGKIDKYEHLTNEEVLPTQQHRLVEEDDKFDDLFNDRDENKDNETILKQN